MATLSLKPNSRKTPPVVKKTSTHSSEWRFADAGVMHHKSGFSIQFFSGEECEITNIPKDVDLTTIRDLTSKAIRARKTRKLI